jgi:phthiocerol/phenolphthiocerol synthesis type-I polyketide synthase E
MDNSQSNEGLEPIAVIGMAGRFPGANNIDEFWQNLRDGVESITFFSDEELAAAGVDPELLSQPNYVKANGVLNDIESFDASFFGITPREAQVMDPQHRLLLECTWIALEQSGYDALTYDGRIGIFGGACMSTYLQKNLLSNPDLLKLMDFDLVQQQDKISQGNDRDYLTTRISYKLGLTGPSVSVNTVCSTSLVAVHLACQNLLNYQCDIALAGGASIQVSQEAGYLYKEGSITSPDGHCRAFDANAQGTIFGNGVGMVALKRLDDAIADGDYIHAVIKGTAINNDGALKVSYTAPSVEGQAAAIAEAQAVAGVDPATITYIEAHGTGTALGDPIEMTALNQVFQASTDQKQFCAIGAVKTNIGHLNRASGIAGLIKIVQALKHQQIPPSLHYESPNPAIDFANSPFFVNAQLRDWQTNGIPRRAGLSSFGFGGTNAHAVLEEAPQLEPSGASQPPYLLVLSAKTEPALQAATQNLAEYLKQHPEANLADVAYTLQVGRRGFNHRRTVVCQNREDAIAALETLDSKRVSTAVASSERPVVFMFSGQGSQYVNMARELYDTEPVFRQEVDRSCDILQPHLGLDLRQILYPSQSHISEATEQLKQTAITQPALFVIEYALAQLWMSWGVQPQATIGHSIGEYVAACIAGVFSLEDALALVAARGKLMQQLPAGTMLAVPLTEVQVKPFLNSELSLAVMNGPSRCVISGTAEAIEMLEKQLAVAGIEGRRLHTSHAFHSHMMEPILEPFTALVNNITLNPPQLPYVSNVTGTWMTDEQATNAHYWATHLRQTVRFAEGVQQFFAEPEQILLEVGPGRTLSTLALQHPQKTTEQVVLTSVRHPQDSQNDRAFLLTTVGKLWLMGMSIEWSSLSANEQRHRLPLPTYPFQKQRYWVEPGNPEQQVTKRRSSESKSSPIIDFLLQGNWEIITQKLEEIEQLSEEEVKEQLNCLVNC